MVYCIFIAWLWLWKIPWSCHGDIGHFDNVVRTVIIQTILLVSTQVVVFYYLTRNMLKKTGQKLPERRLPNWIPFPKIRNYEKLCKTVLFTLYQIYIIFNKDLLSDSHRSKLFRLYWASSFHFSDSEVSWCNFLLCQRIVPNNSFSIFRKTWRIWW